MLMKLTYPILKEEHGENLIFWSPDLRNNLPSCVKNLPHHLIVAHLREAILKELQALTLANKVLPEPVLLPLDERYILVSVDYEIKQGFFRKTLPLLGSFTNLLVVFFTVFTAYLSLQLGYKQKFDDPNTKIQESLAYTGAAGQFFMLMLFYVFSDSSEILKDLGKKLDNVIGGDKNLPNRLLHDMPWYKQIIFILTNLIIFALILISIFVSAVLLSQNSIALMEKAVKEGVVNLSQNMILILSRAVAGLSVYPSLAFTLSFFEKFMQTFKLKLESTSLCLTRQQSDERTDERSTLLRPSYPDPNTTHASVNTDVDLESGNEEEGPERFQSLDSVTSDSLARSAAASLSQTLPPRIPYPTNGPH